MITYGHIGRTGGSLIWTNFRDIAPVHEIYSPKFLLPNNIYCRLFLDCSQNKIGMEMVSPDKCVVKSGSLTCFNANGKELGKEDQNTLKFLRRRVF